MSTMFFGGPSDGCYRLSVFRMRVRAALFAASGTKLKGRTNAQIIRQFQGSPWARNSEEIWREMRKKDIWLGNGARETTWWNLDRVQMHKNRRQGGYLLKFQIFLQLFLIEKLVKTMRSTIKLRDLWRKNSKQWHTRAGKSWTLCMLFD